MINIKLFVYLQDTIKTLYQLNINLGRCMIEAICIKNIMIKKTDIAMLLCNKVVHIRYANDTISS